MSRNAYQAGYADDGKIVTRTFHLGSDMTDEQNKSTSPAGQKPDGRHAAGPRPAVLALTRILGEVADVAKDATLKAKYTHDYRSKEAIFDVFRRRLAAAEIFPLVSMIEHAQVEQKQGKGVALFTVAKFEIEFIHGPSGDSVRSTWYGEAADTNDKGTNKTMTAALRTYFENQFMLSEFADEEIDYEYQKQAAPGPVHNVPAAKAPSASFEDLARVFADNGFTEDDAIAYGDYVAEKEDVDGIDDVEPDRLARWVNGLAELNKRKFRETVEPKISAPQGKDEY